MIVILDNIRSALNVGSILRTCDAFGIREVYFCGITPEKNNSKVLKTSLGAEKGIKAKYFKTTIEAVEFAKNTGYKTIALETGNGAIRLTDFKPEEKIAVVVGNEVSGVSEEVLGICDLVVEIPMSGVKESLNVSVAFGIAVFWLTK